MNRVSQSIVTLMLGVVSGCSTPVVELPIEALGDRAQMDTYIGKTVRVTGKPVFDKVGDCLHASTEYFVVKGCRDFPHGSAIVTVTGELSRYEEPGWSAYMLVNARLE